MKPSLIFALSICWSIAFGQQASTPPGGAAATLDAATRTEVAGKFAQLLADEYAYADLGSKMAAAIRERLKTGAYDNLKSPQEFAAALQADARAVSHDLHLRVGFGMRQMTIRQGPPTAEMAAQSRRQNGGISAVQILEGNIGYMALDVQARQDEAARNAIAAAFAFLRNTDALILDVRGNPGGNGFPELFLSYLSEGAPYLANTVHWRKDNRVQEFRTVDMGAASYGTQKPVYVLTSRTTFSAAECLAYEIQSFKRGVIVGETTGGGANPTGGAGLPPLGYGFSVNIPTGYVVNPVTGTNWEGTGVKPDLEAPAAEALGRAWAAAAERLKAGESDLQRRAVLEALSLARLDGAASLQAAQLAGTYGTFPNAVTITVNERGEICQDQKQPYPAEISLVREGGDRYRPAVFSAGFSMTFVSRDGKVEVVRSDPRGSSILQKQ